ncbi:LWXIA domain-containing protein [Burkholderia stabilis]|uniref:LWXIA domain-containing protein n=1 Tax=Burkholderia stabilis TaxID=95485 RepID=UPI001F4B026A|nr:LWXIA domain-containing protein [Burkholderia stabilis]
MLSIDGMGLGLNWQRFLSQTLNPDLAPKPPQNTDGTSNDGPNNGPANPVNPTAAPPIPVQADLGTDPSKPTNPEISSATALLQSMADQYRVTPPEITVDNDTTHAVQGVIQDAQTKYDNAQQALQSAQGVLRMTSRDPDSTPDEHKAAVDNYTKARTAADTAQRQLDVTTDAGYRILYGEQAKADQYSADPTNQNLEGPAQQQADAKLAALQKLFPDQTKANPNFIPQQGDCKTPDQVQAYDDWQSAASSATVGQAKYWADVSNANLAYTQFQSYMGDPAYKDAIDSGVGKLNDALAPLQLQVDLPDPPAADQNGNVDMNAVQANVTQAAKVANYSNAAYAASLDAQQVTTLQQKYDVDSACLIGSTPGAAKDDKAALDRATTQANTSGSYMQMLGAQLNVDDLQAKYDSAKSASDDWHTANPKSLDPHPQVDADLATASDALAQAKQAAGLAHDGFVVAYGQTLAQQYDDAGSQIDAQLKPKVPFVLQNPTPTLSTNPPPTTTPTPPAPSAAPAPSLSTSLPSASSTPTTSGTPAPSTTQTPSSSLSTSAPASPLSTSLAPTTLFTNPSFVLQPPGSNTSVPTTATGQTALDAKKLHVVAGALRAADGRLSNTYNDAAAKFQLANAQKQEGVLKGKLADMQKTYDDWYANNPTPTRLRMVNGDEIPMPTPLRANPYQSDLDKARSNLQQADATINKLQLLTEMSHQQVLLDQFDASLAENLRNPQSQDDKDAYANALDKFFRAHQGELSQSLLDQAGTSTNKAATIDFGKLTDNEQRNLIGTAIGVAPDVQPSSDSGTATAPVNDDTARYTNKDKLDTINKVRDEILKLGGGSGTQVNILPLIYSDKTSGMVTSALFKVTDSKGNVQYVDDTSAKYDNVGDYLDNNQLASSGTLDLVTGYDGNGHAQFQQKAAHHDDWFDSALNTLTGGKVNLGMMGLGLLMEGAGVLLDATGVGAFAGAALNFGGAVMMDTAIGSSMTKSALDIGSRWDHNQSINPFTDAGARGDWLNLVPMGAAGAAKFAGSEVFGKTVTALTGSAKAARVTTAIVRGTSLVTGVGAAGESFVEAGIDFAHGNSAQGWDALKSGVTNVALMGAGGVRDRVVNRAIRVTGRPVVARSAGGERISIDGQQLQKILSKNEPPQLAFGATRATLDGVDIKVAKDGTLMAGDKVLTYDNMPVRVLDSLNNKDLNNLPKGTSVILGENGELSIVKLTGKTWTEGTKIGSVTETGDRLSFGSDGQIDAPSKLVAKTPTQWQDDLQQANDHAPPADTASNTLPADAAATHATEASNTATATTAASARNAQHTSEAQAARDENQQETRSSDSHVAAQNRRSSDLRAAEDPSVARAPGASGAGAREEPASVAPRTPVRVIDLTDAEPASRPTTLDPAGVSMPRGPSVEALDYGEHTLFIVRNGEDHAAVTPDTARPRATGSLPADVAEPIVVIADGADAHVAPELANRWQRPVFAAAPEALHADGTLRADAPLTRYMPAPDTVAAGGRVVGTNAQAQHADATAGVAEAEAHAPNPDAPAVRRPPPPANEDTVIVLASARRNTADPKNGAAVPQPPARAARALDGAFSAPNRILVLVKPAERTASQAAHDANDASRPNPARDTHAEDHALPQAAHPEITEAPPDPSLAGPGLLTRLQMRFGGAPLPEAVHALAQQSDTLTQQLRMLSDAGWRVSLGKRGGGSRIDPKRRRVTIDGALHDSGSITYTLAHEAKHAVEAIDGTLDGLDYSGRSRFTRKSLEAEARAQINAFEARYEIDLAGGGDIAAKTTLPDAIQHEADRWGPSSDYAGTVERLADAFADAPVSGRHGETYQALYDGIWDKQKRHGGAPRRMPAPHTTESTGGASLPRTLDEQVQWSVAHAEQISPFAERGRHDPGQVTLRRRGGDYSVGVRAPVAILHGQTDPAGRLLDAHGRPATLVDYTLDHTFLATSTRPGSGRDLIFATQDGHAAAAWLANIWQRPVYVPDGGTARKLGAMADRPPGTQERVRFNQPPGWTRYAPSPRTRIDHGELALAGDRLYVAGNPSQPLDVASIVGPFLGAGIEKSVFELGARNAIGLYDVDRSLPLAKQIGQYAGIHESIGIERGGLDVLQNRYGMRTLTIDGPFSVDGRVAILYTPLAEIGTREITAGGGLPKRVTRESMDQLIEMRGITARDRLLFDFEGLFDAQGNFYFSDPLEVASTHVTRDVNRTIAEIDSVIEPLKRGIEDGSIALAHPEIRESLPDGAFVQKPSLITRIRMWFGGAPLSDAAYALAGQSSLLADQMRLLKSDGWQIVLGRAGRGSRTDVGQRRIVIDGGLLSAGTLVYTLAHETGHATDVANNRLGLDFSNPDAYVQSTLLAEARAQANAFAVRKQILDATGIDIAEHAVLPDAIAREADHVMPGDAAGLARLADAFGNAPVSGRNGERYSTFYGRTWGRQQSGDASLHMPAPHTTESTGGARLPRTLDEQVQWSTEHADRVSPFPRRWLGGSAPKLTFSRHGAVSYANGEPLTVVHARTDAAGGLLDARGRPATPIDYSIDHRYALGPDRTGSSLILDVGGNGAAHGAWLANLWQRAIYVPDDGTARTIGEPGAGGTHRMQFGGPRTWTRYTPSPRERIDYGALAADANGLHIAGDPSRRVDPDALLGPFLGAGTAKAVFELGKRNAIGLFYASGDKARSMLAHEKRGLRQLSQLGLRTVTVDGPFTYHGRTAVLYGPLAELGTLDVMKGILPKRVTRESMRQLVAARDFAAQHGVAFDFEGLFDAQGTFHFSDPSVLLPHPDPATNRTPGMIDAVIEPLDRGIANGRIELAHPEISESLPDGAFVQKPSLFTRIRMWFGGAPLSDAAYALAGQSSLLADQMRLLSPGRWEIVQGRAGAGSKIDAQRRRIVIDGSLRQAGTIVYVLAHEIGHAVDVAQNRLDLDTSSPDAYAESALRAEARAQANAFAVRKQILDTTGIDIAEHAVLPDAIAREADHVMPGDEAGLARLADAFGNARTSLPGNPVYRALYRAQAEQAMRDAEAGRTGAAPRTMPSMMMWPVPDPSAFMPAAPALAPEARAADWLDAHGKRDLKRIDGTQLADIRDLAQYAGPNTHVLIAKHLDRPANDGTHPQPDFVASLTTDAHGQPGQPEPADPGGTLSHKLRDAVYPGTRARKRKGGDAPHAARAEFDFYLSPVSLDELRQFGGAAKVEAVDTKRVWDAAPSGKAPADDVVEQIDALARAPQYKRPKAAASAAETMPQGTTLFAVDKKTGKVLGYAEPKPGGGWTYHEKTAVGDASIGPQDLGTAFRRRARGLPDGRRGVVFVASALPESAVSRYGGFEPAERAVPVAEQKPPRLKLGDRVQRRLGKIQALGKPPEGATPLANRWIAPNLLPKSADDVHDFNGANTLHLRRVIELDQVGPAYFIYVYDTEGALIDKLDQPDGIIATRDDTLQWFDDAAHFNDATRPGVDLDKTKIGTGPDGSNRHFLVTQLDPAAFDARAKPTQIAAYALKQAELDKQLKKAAAESSAPFGELESHITAELTAAKNKEAELTGTPAPGAAAGGKRAKPKKGSRRKQGKQPAPAPAPSASPALPAGDPFSIKTYQPGLTSATIVEWIVRFGKAKVDNWFPEHERVKAFAGRRGEPLDLGAKRQVVMADSVMMKALGIPLWLARDVSSMPWHGPLSRPDHARNVLSRHAKSAITYLSPARAADRRMLQAYARAKVEIQDRIALMARGFTLRDNPDEMLALVKRYGGAMPVVSIAVDPHSLAAALGRKHDPAFIRRVRALGKLDNAHFDEANARIEIGGKNRHLELDDLDHLFKWLDAASEGGFVLRLETAPSRALVSAEDQRTLAGTNDAYHDYVRTFDALESWARKHPGQDAPHVMVTFHGWDAVLEPAPGDGHMKLVEAVLDRKGLDWVHLGLSYATHGADFIANQDLTAALARKLVEYKLHAPDKFARLHGADALTRVFERVGTQTLANQHQVLFAEVERVGLAQGMTPDALAALRTDLYEGHTTALMDRARQATIQYSKDHPVKAGPVTKRIKSAQYGTRQAGDTWLGNYGKPATEPVQLKIDAQAGQNTSSTAFWRAVAADPKLAIDETKPVIVNRDIAAQPSHQRVTAQQAALAQLNALRVHRPSFGKRDWMWSLGFGGTMAGASTLVALNVFNGMNMMSSDALSHANTALFVGARAGRVFGAMHQGAVQSLQSGDPRAVHDVLDRLQRSLAQQLSASVHGYNPARLEQLDLLANETRVKASHFVEMHRQGLIGFDDAAAQIKELSADLLANMQGMVGGTSLTQLHRGNSRRLLGLVGRGSAIVGYSGTIAVGVHGLMSTPTVAGALTTASAALAATYTGLVYAVSAHRVNADKRSRVVRLIDSTSDFVGVASGIAGTIAQYDKGHAGLAATAATSTAILLGARLNTHFPNATRWVRKYPTALILVPIGIWGLTQLQSLFFGSPSGGSGSSTHKPQPTPSSPSHQPPPQTGGTPTTGLAPGGTATQPPGTGTPGGTSGTPGSTAPAQPSAPPSPAAQPYIVVSGDSLWVIADAHRQSLLDAAHVSPADQKTMTRAQQDARALNEILQLNPGLASAPNVLYAGQSINVG